MERPPLPFLKIKERVLIPANFCFLVSNFYSDLVLCTASDRFGILGYWTLYFSRYIPVYSIIFSVIKAYLHIYTYLHNSVLLEFTDQKIIIRGDQNNFFDFQKGKRRPLHSFLVACLWVYQYPWICLNILENAWINCSDYVRILNVYDHFTSLTDFKDASGSK